MNFHNFKIVFVGDHAVGKTSLMNRYLAHSDPFAPAPTIGVDFFMKVVQHRGIACRLQLWDTAGQERYRSLISNYVRDAAVVIFVFDLTNEDSLHSLKAWQDLLSEVEEPSRHLAFVVGNKSDVEKDRLPGLAIESVIQKEMGIEHYYVVSAKTGEGVLQMFDDAV